jgi:hypothetical protein
MRRPKYEPLRMGDPVFASNYGKRWMKYDKWLFNKQLDERRSKQLN